jgi:basic membrane protein A
VRRRLILLAVVALIATMVAACGGDDSSSETTAAPETTAATETTMAETTAAPDTSMADLSDFRIAIVAPSAANDLAFTQSVVDAVKSMGITPDISENMFVVDDAAAAIRDYASQGYDLVIAHGSQYGASLQEIAPEFPDVSFAWGTAGDTFGLDNVYAYEAASDQGGYVMGVMAAGLTTSGSIGVIGPIEVGDAALYVNGFIAGAAAAGATANATYTGDFSDVALASQTAQAFLSSGADVLTGTAQMVTGAVSVANDQGIPWFGTQSNQTELAPDIVVASQVYHWEVVLQDILSNIQSGTLGGESYVITLENGGEVIEYNDQYDLPADVKAAGEAAQQGIIDGSISTGA